MSTRRTGRFAKFAKAVSLLAVSLGLSLLPSIASASCVTGWETCRGDADRAFVRGDVGVFRYSLLLDGCDFGYLSCSLSKEKENGK